MITNTVPAAKKPSERDERTGGDACIEMARRHEIVIEGSTSVHSVNLADSVAALERRLAAVGASQGVSDVRLGSNCIVIRRDGLVGRASFSFPLNLAVESAILAEATRVGIPAPTLVHHGMLSNQMPFMIYRELQGTHPTDSSVWESVGQTLARLHMSMRHEVFPDSPTGRPRRRNRLDIALAHSVSFDIPADALASLRLVAQGRDVTTSSGIHGDVRSPNLLMDEYGALCGVIDWSDAHFGDPEQDVAFLEPRFWARVIPAYEETSLQALSQTRIIGHGLGRVLALEVWKIEPVGAAQLWLAQARSALRTRTIDTNTLEEAGVANQKLDHAKR